LKSLFTMRLPLHWKQPSGVDLHGDFHNIYNFMENSWINLICYWNNRIKKTVAACWTCILKNKQKIFDCFWKKKNCKRRKIFFIKKIEKRKKQNKKIIFVKFAPKRSAPKWTSNKMGNAKKGHNKTACFPCTPAFWLLVLFQICCSKDHSNSRMQWAILNF